MGAPQQPLGALQQPLGAPQRPLESLQRLMGATQQLVGAPQQLLRAPQQLMGTPQQLQIMMEHSISCSSCWEHRSSLNGCSAAAIESTTLKHRCSYVSMISNTFMFDKYSTWKENTTLKLSYYGL